MDAKKVSSLSIFPTSLPNITHVAKIKAIGEPVCNNSNVEAKATPISNYRKWGATNGPKFEYYMRFLRAVSNSSYHGFDAFKEFAGDPILNKENLTILMSEVCV